ncbi:MAG: hypothetical protein AB4372_16090 [Xenococcus sp. (in: cyanobacteria)]
MTKIYSSKQSWRSTRRLSILKKAIAFYCDRFFLFNSPDYKQSASQWVG